MWQRVLYKALFESLCEVCSWRTLLHLKCEEQFTFKNNLTAHIRNQHNKLNEYHTCEEFQKVFSSRKNLKEHISKVTVHCEKCDSYFKSKKALKNHKESHSDLTDRTCSECHFVFLSKKAFNKHYKASHKEI